jgi:hypothetical protein
MTKSRGVGRGGARPGSGPKKKERQQIVELSPAATAMITPGMSKQHVDELIDRLALEALARVVSRGHSEAAVVTAARYLLDRTRGKPFEAQRPEPDQRELFDDNWGELLQPERRKDRPN